MPMNQKILPKLTIVGGGSAGWMTAIYLNKLLNSGALNYEIRVIESPDIGIIGVGEATVHSIRFFFAAMGLDERELLAETHATFKSGILFRNWMKPVDGKEHEYFHPFEHQRLGKSLDISTLWFLNKRYEQERYDQGVCLSTYLMERGLSPKGQGTRPYTGNVPYGYHMDATLLARFLRRKAVAAGVIHTEATVTHVSVDCERITAVHAGDQSWVSDIFIDCTGFKSLLLGALKSDNWNSFEDALPCNKAVAMQCEFAPGSTPRSYTTATALSNGWVWQIDLVNRRGTGYVYDGKRLTREQAEAELREFLTSEQAKLTDQPLRVNKVLHLDMKVGCAKEFWIGNCIAVGLAGGFIEPLESTGLHLINLGAGLLATHLSSANPPQAVKDSYNRLMRGFYQDLKQFIVLHYCLSNRDDSEFWREAASRARFCPQLEQLLSVWKHKVCEYHDLAGTYSTTFTDENYRYILYGMQHYPQLARAFDLAESDEVFAELNALIQRTCNASLSHKDVLAMLAG